MSARLNHWLIKAAAGAGLVETDKILSSPGTRTSAIWCADALMAGLDDSLVDAVVALQDEDDAEISTSDVEARPSSSSPT